MLGERPHGIGDVVVEIAAEHVIGREEPVVRRPIGQQQQTRGFDCTRSQSELRSGHGDRPSAR